MANYIFATWDNTNSGGDNMRIYTYQQLQEMLEGIDSNELYDRICRNIKRLRKERSKIFKNHGLNTINPYTSENIAALLNYNHTHYKRFESENDSTKRIPLEKLVMLSIIFDTTLDEIIK